MALTNREKFERERDRCRGIEDPSVADAIGYQFADALDVEFPEVEIPQVSGGRLDGYESKSNGTARVYLSTLRTAHQRGLDLLSANAKTVNQFMGDLTREEKDRRHGLVGPPGPEGAETIAKSSAQSYQSALRAFYRFCTDPTEDDNRPEVAVRWEDVNGSKRIKMFNADSTSKHDDVDSPGQGELDAMREACISSQNTIRDRAFVEMTAGTGQRVTCLVTLRVGDVHLDGTSRVPFPHVELNPEIRNDGDKGAIDRTGGVRVRPFVADVGPVKQWLSNHPLRDPDVRAEVGAPEDFDDCYLFIGDLKQTRTEPADHWDAGSARDMLGRRKDNTAESQSVETIADDMPVNPHEWRGYAYTHSKDLPLDEDVRRAVFGWAPGSDTGEKLYNKKAVVEKMRQFFEAHDEALSEGGARSIAEQVVGEKGIATLAPEDRRALARELAEDEQARKMLKVKLGYDDLMADIGQMFKILENMAGDDMDATEFASEVAAGRIDLEPDA